MDTSQKFDDYSLAPVSPSMAMNAGEPHSSTGHMSSYEEANQQSRLENPSLEEILFDNRAALKIITSRYAVSHIDPDIRKHLFFQIDWLLKSEEWEDGDNFPNAESFKTLIKFILNSSPLESPSLGLSDSGNLLASWIRGENKLILECMAKDHFKYLAASVADGKKKRSAGDAESLRDLLDLLSPFKTAGWFNNNGKNS